MTERITKACELTINPEVFDTSKLIELMHSDENAARIRSETTFTFMGTRHLQKESGYRSARDFSLIISLIPTLDVTTLNETLSTTTNRNHKSKRQC